MIYYKNFNYHFADMVGDRKKVDNTIYSFDIETTSYIIIDNKILPAIEYKNLLKDEQERAEFRACMYIWQFSINDVVYYGRTWQDLEDFLDRLEMFNPNKKIVFVHNLSFEFQFLKSFFELKDVLARKSHKVMQCFFNKYNIELRCTLFLSNCALEYIPKLFNLPIQKLKGDLDYTKIRTSITPIEENPKELQYCENDCLIIYYYIIEELKTYKRVDKIPLTSTGHVRRELKEKVLKDYEYKRKVKQAININPHVYNLLQDAFAGGYTHANYIYTDEIIKNVVSYDFTSSYPYVLVTHKFPSKEFKKCYIKDVTEMIDKFAYILVVKFKNLRCKYYNTFISASKCRNIKGARYDNGRIIQADELIMTITDIDFKFYLKAYKCEYEIIEAYYSRYDYLPKQFINFVLEKYIKKTQYKNVDGKEVEYMKEKNKFNSLYGMSVTNTIRDEVTFDYVNGWNERQLTNEEIVKALISEQKKSFLSFAYGVWVTAHARNNLLQNVLLLDDYVIYCDTDSIKLKEGFDKKIIDNYNNYVKNKIENVSKHLEIEIEKFSPKDIFGVEHMLGIFDCDAIYDEFITQGAKKYAVTKWIKNEKIKNDMNIIEKGKEKSKVLEITVAGVPKKGAKQLKNLSDFKDNLVFEFENTNKNLVVYCENQTEIEITDYKGKKCIVKDKSGCCLIPTTYVLGKSDDYANLLTENSSNRARYVED